MNAPRLDITQSYLLMTLVKEEFVKSDMNDSEFAEYAVKTLDFFVNNDHVKTRRNALGIPPKTPKKLPERTVDSILDLINELECRVAKLEGKQNER
jgi:hypothetical protein